MVEEEAVTKRKKPEIKQDKPMKPFPKREYQALSMLAGADVPMTTLELQMEAGLDPYMRNMARAAERLRAFGHVGRKLERDGGKGRPEWVYWITEKGRARLKWLDEHDDNYCAAK